MPVGVPWNELCGTLGGRLFSLVNSGRAQPVIVSVFVQDELQLGFRQVAKGRGAIDPPHNFGQTNEHLHIRARHAFIHDDSTTLYEKEGPLRAFTL